MRLDECSALVEVPQVLFFLHTFRPGGGVEGIGQVLALIDLDLSLTEYTCARVGSDRGGVFIRGLGLRVPDPCGTGAALDHVTLFHDVSCALAEVLKRRDC